MSKYIRTKDGIYDTSKGIYTPSIKMFAIGFKTIYEKDIIAQADTIEELCDEFVIKHLRSKKPYIADEYQKTQILKDRQKAFTEYGVEEVKGGIWTDMGLIYIAKMNENGELELI